jgi:hypothetical protein
MFVFNIGMPSIGPWSLIEPLSSLLCIEGKERLKNFSLNNLTISSFSFLQSHGEKKLKIEA